MRMRYFAPGQGPLQYPPTQGHPSKHHCLYMERNLVARWCETNSQVLGMSENKIRTRECVEIFGECAHWVLCPRPSFQCSSIHGGICIFGDECLGSLLKLSTSKRRGRGHGAWE